MTSFTEIKGGPAALSATQAAADIASVSERNTREVRLEQFQQKFCVRKMEEARAMPQKAPAG